MCHENYQCPSLLDFPQHRLHFGVGGVLVVVVFLGLCFFLLVWFWFCFGRGGVVLKILLSVALPQAERNTSVPCPVQKAKAISSTQIWGPLQAILRPVVNWGNTILPCFILWNSWRLFCTLSDTTYLPRDYTNFTLVQPLCISRSIPAYCWQGLQKTAWEMYCFLGLAIFAVKFMPFLHW